jgi:hypothetical protein
MSALPPKADIRRRRLDVRFVPLADKVRSSKKCLFDHLKSLKMRRELVIASLKNRLLRSSVRPRIEDDDKQERQPIINIRTEPIFGHKQDVARCPRKRRNLFYSITSPARPSNVFGTLRPNARRF